jgi:hypothetical protein
MIQVRVYCSALPQVRPVIELAAETDGTFRVVKSSAPVSADVTRRTADALAVGRRNGVIEGFAWTVEEQEGPCL